MTGRLEHWGTGGAPGHLDFNWLRQAREADILASPVPRSTVSRPSEYFPTIWKTTASLIAHWLQAYIQVPRYLPTYLPRYILELCQFVEGARQAKPGNHLNTRFSPTKVLPAPASNSHLPHFCPNSS